MTFSLTLRLLDKTAVSPTGVTEGSLVDGDLTSFMNKLEYSNVGNRRINNALLSLDVPADGRFVRASPVLVDELTKTKYLVEFQITQGVNSGKVFRGELGQPTVNVSEGGAEILQIPLIGIELITKEYFWSEKNILYTPKQRFIDVVTGFNANAGASGMRIGFVGGSSATAISLPDTDSLKQNWQPFAPKPTSELLVEVIERLADVIGGQLTDYYYDYEPDPIVTRQINIEAKEFGSVDSGVIINPLTVAGAGSEDDQNSTFDNQIYKNLIIAKGSPNGGSLPMEHTRFASEYLHASQRPEWDNSFVTYNVGDLIKRTFLGTFPETRFFVCILQHISSAGVLPESTPLLWTEDFTIDPNNTSLYFSYTPWTASLDDWQSNMVGLNNVPTGYAGYMVDWNIARTLYDRDNPLEHRDRVSAKYVTRRTNTPPITDEKYDGNRFIVGVLNSKDVNMAGAFVGHRGKIAEWIGDQITGSWYFSEAPNDDGGSGSARKQDIAFDLDTGTSLKWDDTANGGDGDWVVAWDVTTDGSKPSPFHLVENLGLVTGATGIPVSAIEATFNWKNPLLTGTNPERLSSRGAWLTFWFPFPRLQGIHGTIGHEYGDGTRVPYLDTNNLDHNRFGFVGWNQGLDSEDMGRVSAVRFKLRLGIYTSSDDSEVALGYANLPMIFWAMDKFDRVFWSEFSMRFNNQWQSVKIPIGDRAPQKYFFSRVDELAQIFGHSLPFDFFLEEREYTGVQFDWRFVKVWGVMMKDSYSVDSGLYVGGVESVKQSFEQLSQQAYHSTIEFLYNLATQQPTINRSFLVDHTKIAMDELFFEKELYALSQQVPVSDPRMEIYRLESEQDYKNLRLRAQAQEARKTFFPQFWHIKAEGDVRVKLGESFTISGPRVPSGSQTLVCAEVKHILDSSAYNMEIVGVRKFTI